MKSWTARCIVVASAMGLATAALAQPASPTPPAADVIRLYPGKAPGDWTLPVAETTKMVPLPSGQPTPIVFNVSDPTLTIVRPAPGHANGASMIVLPGGGFFLLVTDLEGLQMAHWLADRGITAFVLKYRVRDLKLPAAEFAKLPAPFDGYLKFVEPNLQIASGDAQQAVRVVRRDAAKYGIDPARVGMMGFSAGAITTVREITTADAASRPNLAASIYGGALGTPPVNAASVPLFIAAAHDDEMVPMQKSLALFDAWTKGGAPVELLVTEDGKHGFGMGRPGTTSENWTAMFETWLRKHSFVGTAATTKR